MRSNYFVAKTRASGRAKKVLAIGLLAMVVALLFSLQAATPAYPQTSSQPFVVNSTADPGTGTCDVAECTLREAINAANDETTNPGKDTINISATSTINLQSGLVTVSDMEINGPGSDQLTVRRDAAGNFPVFKIFDSNVTISGLTATNGSGGGGDFGGISVINSGHSVTLRDVTVTGNKGITGGIGNSGGTLTLIDSTVSGNEGGSFVGGIFNYEGATVTLTSSTVSGNSSSTGVGGISNYGTFTLTNSTVSGNSRRGIDNAGTLTLNNSTLSDNSSTFAANLNNFGTATFKNTIAANPKGGGDNCYSHNSPINSQGHNLEHPGTSCGFTGTGDIQDQDPKLGTLANNGGKTQTHALLSGSPAIDAADDDACPTTDQRGVERPTDGDNNNTFVCDIGAFEGPGPLPPSLPPSNDNFANAQHTSGSSASLSGTTRGATRETGEPDHLSSGPEVGDHSVWYRWTAPATRTATIDTCTANIDSILSVYTGGQLKGLSKVADNNDGCASGTGSKVTFNAQAGTVYRIAVADAGGASESTFTLALDQPDTTPPEVTGVTPPKKRGRNITVKFSEPLHRSIQLETDVNDMFPLITLVEGDATSTSLVPAKVSCQDAPCQTITVDPFGPSTDKLAQKQMYTLKIEGGGDGDARAVRDQAGNELAQDFVSSFTTRRR